MRMTKACAICNTPMSAKPSCFKRARYCSKACAHRGMCRRRNSQQTEFKKGCNSEKALLLGTERVRQRRNRLDQPRVWVKVAEHEWKLRAVLVWEREHGLLPKGIVVHHRDRNSLNDVPENLVALTRAEHIVEHRAEYEEKRRKACSIAATKRHAENRTRQPALAL